MKDPPGNVEIRASTLVLAGTRVEAHFGVKPIEGSGFINKCDLTDIRYDVNQAMATRIRVTCVSPINFALLTPTNRHFNLFGVRIGSNDTTVPNSLKIRLKSISDKLKDALKGCCPAIVLMEGTLPSAHPLAGYLGEAEKAYAALIEEVLRKNSTSHVHTGGGAQVYMR